MRLFGRQDVETSVGSELAIPDSGRKGQSLDERSHFGRGRRRGRRGDAEPIDENKVNVVESDAEKRARVF